MFQLHFEIGCTRSEPKCQTNDKIIMTSLHRNLNKSCIFPSTICFTEKLMRWITIDFMLNQVWLYKLGDMRILLLEKNVFQSTHSFLYTLASTFLVITARFKCHRGQSSPHHSWVEFSQLFVIASRWSVPHLGFKLTIGDLSFVQSCIYTCVQLH